MKKFMITTALSTVLAAAVLPGLAVGSYAQTATTEAPASTMDNFVPPDGYSRFEDRTMLSVELLQGATIYDATGETVGEISDLVLSTKAAPDSLPTDSNADASAGTGATDTTLSNDPSAIDPATDGTAPATSTDIATGTATDPTPEAPVTGTETATGTTTTDGTTPGVETDTATATTDGTAAGSGTDVAETGMADGTNTGGTADVVTDPTIAETATDKDPADGNVITTDESIPTPDVDTTVASGSGDSTESEVTLAGSRITHVVVDTGGFLGLGVYTVALPIEALEIYTGASDDYRIYLPWTEDQLRDLPEYDANDPATLGQTTILN